MECRGETVDDEFVGLLARATAATMLARVTGGGFVTRLGARLAGLRSCLPVLRTAVCDDSKPFWGVCHHTQMIPGMRSESIILMQASNSLIFLSVLAFILF